MGEKIRISAKTVADAVIEASIRLGTTSDNIEYVVIEHETKGFFGLGAKKAVIEAKIKKTDEEFISELFSERKGGTKKAKGAGKAKSTEGSVKKSAPAPAEKAPQDGAAGSAVSEAAATKAKRPAEQAAAKEAPKAKEAVKETAKETVKAAGEAAEAAAQTTTGAGEGEGKEGRPERRSRNGQRNRGQGRGQRGERGPKKTQESPEKAAAESSENGEAASAAKPAKSNRVPADPEVAKERAKTFLTQTFEAMGLHVDIETRFEDDVLSVDLIGDDMGMLIGKRGQTLDSLQYLTSLVVNKGKASYVRVKLDTEDYRNRRKATLENLAKNIAFKVKKTRRPVYLEPMNPYERRIIHSALQNDPFVTTHSEGEEPNRKVVVTMKKRERTERSDRIAREEKAVTDELV